MYHFRSPFNNLPLPCSASSASLPLGELGTRQPGARAPALAARRAGRKSALARFHTSNRRDLSGLCSLALLESKIMWISLPSMLLSRDKFSCLMAWISLLGIPFPRHKPSHVPVSLLVLEGESRPDISTHGYNPFTSTQGSFFPRATIL